jgi:hypothetical protein
VFRVWIRCVNRARFLIFSLGFLASAGCAFPARKPKRAPLDLPQAPAPKDTSIQDLLRRLRAAVFKRDGAALAAEMTAEFGYRWDSNPESEDFFDYWTRKQLWGELSRLIEGRLVAKDDYLVGPPEFVTNSSYKGPRIGFRIEDQRWKFAYFLEGDDPSGAPAD